MHFRVWIWSKTGNRWCHSIVWLCYKNMQEKGGTLLISDFTMSILAEKMLHTFIYSYRNPPTNGVENSSIIPELYLDITNWTMDENPFKHSVPKATEIT